MFTPQVTLSRCSVRAAAGRAHECRAAGARPLPSKLTAPQEGRGADGPGTQSPRTWNTRIAPHVWSKRSTGVPPSAHTQPSCTLGALMAAPATPEPAGVGVRTRTAGLLPGMQVNCDVKSLPLFQHLSFTFPQISHPGLNKELPRCFSKCYHVTVHINRWGNQNYRLRSFVSLKVEHGGGQRKRTLRLSQSAHTDPTRPDFLDPVIEERHRARAQRGSPDTCAGLGESVQVSRHHRSIKPTANTSTSLP